MRRLRNFLRLPASEQLLLLEAALRMLFAHCAIGLVSFPLIVRLLRPPRQVAKTVNAAQVREIRWAVETAARVMPLQLLCLPQGLAAFWMLRARGAAPQLHYGVTSRAGDGFESHVWVEVEGFPVVGHRNAADFTLLTTFPERESGTL